MKENNIISESNFEDCEDDGILIPVKNIYILEKLRKDNQELDQRILELDQKILELDQKILEKELDQKILEKEQKVLELTRENEELKEKLRKRSILKI